MTAPPAHLLVHPSEVQMSRRALTLEEVWSVEDWIRANGTWGYSMVLDDSLVTCPACKATVYESRIGAHVWKCTRAQESAGINTQEEG